MFSVILFILLLSSRCPLFKSDCDLEKFKKANIVPAIVPEIPAKDLKVIYGNHSITCGEDINITIAKEAPVVKFDASNIEFYTLVMIDPDAPDPHRPVFSQFLQWLVVDIPGDHVSKGKPLKMYMPPSPPVYSAPHRYIFLVFQQPNYFFGTTFMSGKGRSRFSVANMLKELEHTDLVAGNFFYAHSEEIFHY